MLVLEAVIIGILAAALCFMYFRTEAVMNRLERMVDAALEDRLLEEEFSESRLSRLESRLYQYLNAGRNEAAQIEKERNSIKELIGDISHQTKTPIANILLYTQLLAEREELAGEAEDGQNADGDRRSAELVEQLQRQTRKLDFLIQSLVKLSRLENGILTLTPRRESVAELLEGLDYEQAAARKGVEFVIEPDSECTAVFDMKWTLEALSNVVDNAVKYTPEGGRVCVRVKAYEMFVSILVEDTGRGITEEESARIFTRFYRSPRSAAEEGVGVGLYLAREILRREGGYIGVRSKPGAGSVFSLFLPA